jgi:L-ascorbate metabolism protein UlaG (beta-lactamase superfamily)
MKIIKQFLKWIGYLLLVILGSALIWFFTTPQFGGSPTEKQIAEYKATDHHDGETFFNYKRANMDMDASMIWEIIKEFRNPVDNIKPKDELIPEKLDANEVSAEPEKAKITWFGHSSFMIELDGKVILLDPMFGQQAAPHPWLGTDRYNPTFPLEIDELPQIDVVVFSHDHYDHLDHGSVIGLAEKVNHWLVPLGLDNHLAEWGIDSNKITALDWWEESMQGDIMFVLTPSRHFSGRGLSDRMATLWGSWVIKGDSSNIYFSGDGGYGDHFKEIGEKYGPFDIGLMECGQYNHKWADIHMMPEESVQASIDVKAKVMMPVHWGAFTLSVHSWIEPVQRASIEATKLGVKITTPKIGEQIILNETYPASEWWLDHLETAIN